jgi:hypothetical protein
VACPAGQYQPNAGQVGCAACPAGTYSGARASGCASCGAGQYQDAAGQSGCKACSAWGTANGNHTYCPYPPSNSDKTGRVQGYCAYGQNQVASGTDGKTYTGSTGGVPGGGTCCHCRLMNQVGAWSSWIFAHDAGNCNNSCAYSCWFYAVTIHGPKARW